MLCIQADSGFAALQNIAQQELEEVALALAAVMAIPMAVPGFAASNNTHWVTATLDGSQVFRESYPAGGQISEIDLVDDLGVGVDISVSVNGNVVSTTRPVNATGTLTNGTVYRLAEDSDRSLKLSTTNNKLADDLTLPLHGRPLYQ